MGILVDGVWQNVWYDTEAQGGQFKRNDSVFRNWLTVDGSAEATGKGGFKAQKDRYHIYVSYACPWAHRVLIFRVLKKLEAFISISVVHPYMLENGWTFSTDFADTTGDTLYNKNYLYEIYLKANKNYSGNVTVPILWDKEQETIVSNESSEIIRMLNSQFDHLGAAPGDYYPIDLRAQIDEVNAWIYPMLNNGVYRAGFASSQDAYDEAVNDVFKALEKVEEILSKQKYLVGDRLTEADIRLWTTLVRFDPVYITHFKCDKKRILDYPNILSFLRAFYQVPGIKETVQMEQIRHHYFYSHQKINPNRIISIGADDDLAGAHDRDTKFAQSQQVIRI